MKTRGAIWHTGQGLTCAHNQHAKNMHLIESTIADDTETR